MITSSDIFKADILIVDDLSANVLLLEKMLREAGYISVASTQDPRAVCELHRKNRYALILLDLQMPDLDGFQVMERLAEIEPDGYLPVLVITAQPLHKLRALKGGAKDFISKPFELAEVLARVHNLIEVRLLHLETKKLHTDLQAANEELDAFNASVSHDLRAPARRILGFTGILQKEAGPSLSEKSLEHLTSISRSAIEMGNLIRDLLEFSRLGRSGIQKKDVDVGALVKETVSDLQSETAGRKIAWNIHPLPHLRADRALLRMVFFNLISNAVKFTSARADTKIEIGCNAAAESEDAIFIRDNGAGFDSAYSNKLFGVFQRLHSQKQFEGTGIGLANVRRIIQRHGGRTWAEGVVDAGATFYFSIPKQPSIA